MDLYLYSTPTTSQLSVAQSLMSVGELYNAGIIRDDSAVWLNADRPDQGLWVLTDRSNHVFVVNAPCAGWIRLRKGRVSWGRTASDAQNRPSTVINLDDLAGDRQREFHVVVNHREYGAVTKVLTPRHSQRAIIDGVCSEPPFVVVDLQSFVNRDVPDPPNDFDRAHAMVNGVALMTVGLGPHSRADVMNNIDDYKITLDPSVAAALTSPMASLGEFAGTVMSTISARLTEHGSAPLVDLVSVSPAMLDSAEEG